MTAMVEENRAKVVEAEASIPWLSRGLPQRQLGVMELLPASQHPVGHPDARGDLGQARRQHRRDQEIVNGDDEAIGANAMAESVTMLADADQLIYIIAVLVLIGGGWLAERVKAVMAQQKERPGEPPRHNVRRHPTSLPRPVIPPLRRG